MLYLKQLEDMKAESANFFALDVTSFSFSNTLPGSSVHSLKI